jgi:hypothetical protein
MERTGFGSAPPTTFARSLCQNRAMTLPSRRIAPIAAAFAALLLAACGPSEEEIKADFGAFVDSANRCEVAADCTLVYPGCPLGCFVSVRADRAEEAMRYAQELISDYESGGASCDYECTEAPRVTCVQLRCGFLGQ